MTKIKDKVYTIAPLSIIFSINILSIINGYNCINLLTKSFSLLPFIKCLFPLISNIIIIIITSIFPLYSSISIEESKNDRNKIIIKIKKISCIFFLSESFTFELNSIKSYYIKSHKFFIACRNFKTYNLIFILQDGKEIIVIKNGIGNGSKEKYNNLLRKYIPNHLLNQYLINNLNQRIRQVLINNINFRRPPPIKF